MRCLPLVMGLVLFSLFNVHADTIHVPGDQPTIQAAIDAAVAGDTVSVAPGTYVENIDFTGKAILLQGEEGWEQTYIDGNQNGSVVTIDSGEGPDSVLEGFTLFNGDAYEGGGIYCGETVSPTVIANHISGNTSYGGAGMYNDTGSAPTISGCLFSANTAFTGSGELKGGGIANYYSNAVVTGCTFKGNLASVGGGISSYQGEPVIRDCSFFDNIARGWYLGMRGPHGGEGGAIHNEYCESVVVDNCLFINNAAEEDWAWGTIGFGGAAANFGGSSCTVEFVNCTFYGNIARSGGFGGGIYTGFEANAAITNCIFWDNTPSEIEDHLLSATTVTFSCVMGGYTGTGNIDSDPLFVDPSVYDFHLTYDSPCRDSGDNAAVTDVHDFEGDPRIAWSGTVDMGADEFYTHLYYTGDATPEGDIEGKLIGLPGTWPVGLFFGSGLLETPWHHQWGDFWLAEPWFVVPLVPMPASGVLVMPFTIPRDPPAPWDLPMQALVGLNADSLSNLCVLTVR